MATVNPALPFIGGIVIGYLTCLWLLGEALLKYAEQDNEAVRYLCDRIFWRVVPWPLSRLLDGFARHHHDKQKG